DIVAFSISFEADYMHVLDCLALAGMPLRREDRAGGGPLVLAGGPATFLNPEPVADFVGLYLISLAAEMLDEIVDRAAPSDRGREALHECAEGVGAAYRPDRYTPEYDRAGDLVAFTFDGPGTGRVERRYVVDLDRHPTESTLLAPEAVFGDMYLV